MSMVGRPFAWAPVKGYDDKVRGKKFLIVDQFRNDLASLFCFRFVLLVSSIHHIALYRRILRRTCMEKGTI